MVGETNEIPLHYCYSGKVKRWWVDKPVAVNGGVGVPHIVGEDSSLCQLGDNLLWFSDKDQVSLFTFTENNVKSET